MIAQHKNARTTSAVRDEIAVSTYSEATLGQRFGIGESTVYKWKALASFYDALHTAHRLQITLTPAQIPTVVELRKTLLEPLDDLLAVTRELLCAQARRSSLDRCLRRHSVGYRNALKSKEPTQPHKAFKSCEPSSTHCDAKSVRRMPGEPSRRYLFVAIDRPTRWVFVQIKIYKTAAAAHSFFNALHKVCSIKTQKILTDKGNEFNDKLFVSRERQATGKYEYDQVRGAPSVSHRLTKPRAPRTHGIAERFNGHVADVLKTDRFSSCEGLEQTRIRYSTLYNHQLPHAALKSKTTMRTMKDRYACHRQLLVQRPYANSQCDT